MNKEFSTEQRNLVLDFKGVCDVTFNTGDWCIFDTGDGCVFETGDRCVFNTDDNCQFKTDGGCIFYTADSCEFKTGEECVVVRRDIYEVIELPKDQRIRLKEYAIKGYEVIEEEEKKEEEIMILNGKKYKLTEIKE